MHTNFLTLSPSIFFDVFRLKSAAGWRDKQRGSAQQLNEESEKKEVNFTVSHAPLIAIIRIRINTQAMVVAAWHPLAMCIRVQNKKLSRFKGLTHEYVLVFYG